MVLVFERAVTGSGCRDNETAADTTALARSRTTGAMTFCFVLALETRGAAAYGVLLDSMNGMLAGTPDAHMAAALAARDAPVARGLPLGSTGRTVPLGAAPGSPTPPRLGMPLDMAHGVGHAALALLMHGSFMSTHAALGPQAGDRTRGGPSFRQRSVLGATSQIDIEHMQFDL